MNKWVIDVQEDPESKDLFIELPQDALSQVGWDFGDTIQWDMQEDGTIVLTKKETENANQRKNESS